MRKREGAKDFIFSYIFIILIKIRIGILRSDERKQSDFFKRSLI